MLRTKQKEIDDIENSLEENHDKKHLDGDPIQLARQHTNSKDHVNKGMNWYIEWIYIIPPQHSWLLD